MEIYLTIIGLLISNIIAPIITYHIAKRKTINDFNNKALRNRYELLYVPLRNVLLEVHITGVRSGFYLNQRVKRALPFFKHLRIKEGLKRLSKTFGANPIYEVEFGNDFPLEEIKTIAKKHAKWADVKLLSLVQEADRASYESRAHRINPLGASLLESEKVELAEHIWNTYENLSKRLLPKT